MNANNKYHILMQGMISNNVSETCKEFGISRTIYYQWCKAYQEQGMDGLAEKERRPVMPNKVDKRTERFILQYVAKFPEDGPKRIFYELQDEGVNIGESGIYNVLRRNRLSKRIEREAYAKEIKAKKRDGAQAANSRGCKEKPKPLDYKMKNPENAHPGYMCQQSISYMGVFPRVGKVYQYVVYDAYSRLGLVKLYNRKSSIQFIDFMHLKVIPLMKTLEFQIDNLVTNKSREFTTNWDRGKHKYSDFLHKNNINQVAIAADQTEVFQPLQQFVAVLSKEFYQQAWLDVSIGSFETLEKRLHEYLRIYNFSRVITDGPNRGKIPSDVALEYSGQRETLPLWLFTRR
ncbi:transposase [Paenibacillus sp. PastF-3]|uniref:helix-turn-helix domain-containing protein n=1 Tax=Paenibacillus sp. PastF-3 TaxID=2940626 RepID=UPI0024750481|nr:helix-turn-helix domain-containing protein [Paenibacillus sp. PastF-3]MDH6371438.1 transposase [Paenibacillus sp. PastF-3]